LPGLKKAKQLLELGSDYDTLISVSHPFTGHLVGYNLKKYHPRMQWLVDIGDPFCFLEHMPTNNHSLYKKLNYAFEEKVFIQANAVTVTTELTLKIYADIFPETAEKIRVIPPLLSLDTNYNCQNLVFSTKTNNLRLVFVGTLHQLMRKPDFLLKIFEKLLTTHLAEKLELHFVGSLNNCEDFFKEYNKLFNEKIFFHGKVSHYQALQAMKEADVLVNIGNEFPYQLPSKVVEYVSLGKPILNIAKVAEDSSAAFFKSYPASLCLFEEKEGVDSDQFSKLIQFLDQLPSVDCNQLEHWLETYCITAISEGYKSLIH
jgi:glycosyltransferase involved in cell wall biosynthesis